MPAACAKAFAPTMALFGAAPKLMQLGEHLAGGVELGHHDVVGVGQLVLAHHEHGGELFERGVAGALADAVDGALGLADAGFDRGDAYWRRRARDRRGSARRGRCFRRGTRSRTMRNMSP
jgi:hypothetical protein